MLALLVLGSSIVLAGSHVLEPDRSDAKPSVPSVGAAVDVSPEPASPRVVLLTPTLDPPAAIIRQRTWTATGRVPAAYVGRRGFRVQVLRNGRVVGQARVGPEERFRIARVELRRGRNRMTARIVAPRGESPDSTAVLVVVDDVAPRIIINQPRVGTIVNATAAHVRGRTEKGARLTLANGSSGHTVSPTVQRDGRFETDLRLATGVNDVTIVAVDEAGNRSTRQLGITRGEGAAKARLGLSRDRYRLDSLPSTVSVRVLVLDADGRPVDGAPVTFSISPPGQPTSTYRTVSDHGAATWDDVHLPADGAVPGTGLVTVLAELDDGGVVQDLAEFSFR